MNVALRAVWEALGSTPEGASRWRGLIGQVAERAERTGPVDSGTLALALRASTLGGSADLWLSHLRQLGVITDDGRIDRRRSEAVADALELVGESFRSFGPQTGWGLVATLPPALRELLDPPPVLQTGGVLLELIDGAGSEIQLAMPYVDDAAVDYLLSALLAAGRRGADVSIVTSAPNGQKFAGLMRRWPSTARGEIRVTEVATQLSPLGSHAKAVVVDRARAYVGSANLTGAGLARNIELGVELKGPQVADLARILFALERLGTPSARVT